MQKEQTHLQRLRIGRMLATAVAKELAMRLTEEQVENLLKAHEALQEAQRKLDNQVRGTLAEVFP